MRHQDKVRLTSSVCVQQQFELRAEVGGFVSCGESFEFKRQSVCMSSLNSELKWLGKGLFAVEKVWSSRDSRAAF